MAGIAFKGFFSCCLPAAVADNPGLSAREAVETISCIVWLSESGMVVFLPLVPKLDGERKF
jgi:hypothetical protein